MFGVSYSTHVITRGHCEKFEHLGETEWLNYSYCTFSQVRIESVHWKAKKKYEESSKVEQCLKNDLANFFVKPGNFFKENLNSATLLLGFLRIYLKL